MEPLERMSLDPRLLQRRLSQQIVRWYMANRSPAFVLALLSLACAMVPKLRMVGVLLAAAAQGAAKVYETTEAEQVEAEAEAAAAAKARQEAEAKARAEARPQAEAQAQEEKKETTVYVTKTGSKYHRVDCRYLKKSKIETTLSAAKGQGYEPCSVCNPPS